MATIKCVLDQRAAKLDKTYPIKLKLFHGSGVYIGLDLSVQKEQWDGKEVIKDHPRSKLYNKIIHNKLLLAENILLELSSSHRLSTLSANEIKAMIENNNTEKVEPKIKQHLLSECFDAYIKNIYNARTRAIYEETLTKINSYTPKITMESVSYSWLMDFDAYMSTTCAVNTRGIHMRNIRAVYNDSMKRKLIDRNLYPFWYFKIKKAKTIMRHLTIAQIKQIRDYPVQPHQEKYRQLFLLTFYLIGINMVDLLHLKEIEDGRINYNRAKTNRYYSIEVLPEAQAIINQYKGSGYLLDVMNHYKSYKDFTARMNENLKEIGEVKWVKNKAKDPKFVKKNVKQITPLFPELIIYTARKSWATIASKIGIDKDTIAMALGHGGKTVTDDYVDFDMAKVDQANKLVLKAIR